MNITPVLIIVEHAKTCLSCDDLVTFGQAAWWVKGVGVWHEDCPRPRSLETLAREAEQRRKLGL